MSGSLLPQTFWFRLALACPRVDNMLPAADVDRVLDLPTSCRLPSTTEFEGGPAWATLSAGWNPRGLGFVVEVGLEPSGRRRTAQVDVDPDGFGGLTPRVQFWIDTRDTRDTHRASRFCHRFDARFDQGLAENAAPEAAFEVKIQQRSIARALGEAPTAPSDATRAHGRMHAGGWRLEVFFDARALHGFDPDTNRRLGFNCAIFDPTRGEQFLYVDRAFPIGEDPSLWQVLDLIESSMPPTRPQKLEKSSTRLPRSKKVEK